MKILPNGVAVIEGDTHHAVWCAQEGLVHDKWMANQISLVLYRIRNKVCVDAGANIGTLTQAMINAGAEAVHAFEPNPDAVACLRHNCPTAIVHAVGLSDKPAQVALAQCDNAGARHVVKEPGVGNCCDTAIQLQTLDSFRLKPGLIKLDIEGCEVAALRGAKETIAKNRPVIIAEVNAGALARQGYDPQDLFSFLGAYGYKWTIMQPGCAPDSPQYDILALPR
jgi:FkbM family methyltransferase